MNVYEPNSWISTPHMKDWMRGKKGVIVDNKIVSAFVDYLEADLPWTGPHIDWEQIGGSKLALTGVEDPVLWARGHTIGRHKYALVVRGRFKPGLAVTIDAMMSSIDTLAWGAPGALYFCGCDSIDPITPVFTDLAEYDGTEYLIAN